MPAKVTAAATARANNRPPLKQRLAPLLLLTPALLCIAVYLGYPLVRQIIMSFQKFGLEQQFGAAPTYVGFANYRTILADPALWQTIGRSLLFCVVCAALTMVIGVSTALLLTKAARPAAVFLQSIMLIAWAMPVMSTMQVFQWIFDERSGVVNWLLAKTLGNSWRAFEWLGSPLPFFIVATVIVVWMSVPLVMFMTYASILQVDTSMIEAARIDGADARGIFRFITVPTIAPVLLLVSLLQIIWGLRVFTQINILQRSSSIPEETNVLGTYVFNIGIGGGNYGAGSAASLIILLLTVLLTWRYIVALKRQSSLS